MDALPTKPTGWLLTCPAAKKTNVPLTSPKWFRNVLKLPGSINKSQASSKLTSLWMKISAPEKSTSLALWQLSSVVFIRLIWRKKLYLWFTGVLCRVFVSCLYMLSNKVKGFRKKMMHKLYTWTWFNIVCVCVCVCVCMCVRERRQERECMRAQSL